MGDDHYGAALLAMGMRLDFARPIYDQMASYQSETATLLNNMLAPLDKRATAIAYLRERKLYCLDSPVGRIPPQARPMTLLDKWMKERHK